MTSFMVAELMVLTMVAIREAIPMGEKAMTNSVIFSMVSLASSMMWTSLETRSPRYSRATPRNREKMMIWSILALAMAWTTLSGNQETTLSMKL